MEFLSLDWAQLASNLLRLAIAFILTLPIAWNRERSSRSLGLRTFPLVAVASCGFALLSTSTFVGDIQAQARVIQGLMTGIGFIGGGAILKQDGDVQGTATAASIWGTGVVGAACAYARYEIAILVALTSFALIIILTPVKSHIVDGDGDD